MEETVNIPKKNTAVLMAVLFNFWAWLYTFHKDYWKFWTCLVVSLLFLSGYCLLYLLELASMPSDDNIAQGFRLIFQGILIFIYTLIWLSVVLDTTIKSRQTYEKSGIKTPVTAVVLSIIIGPMAWLYTFNKDKWKFWVSLVLVVASIVVLPWLLTNDVFPYFKQLYKAGYVDLNWPFSLRLRYFWMYVRLGYEYYYANHCNNISLIIPILAWAYPVVENTVRLFQSKQNTQKIASQLS
jgi:hypothetical protein